MAAARAAVHVVNISPSTFKYYLFLYGGSAVAKRHHRRRPPLAEAVFINIYRLLENGLFWTQNSLHGRLLAACGTLCCKYVNVRNSRYLGLLCANPSTVPQGGVTGFINGKNAFMLVECVSPFPQYRDNDRSVYKPFRAQFERIACPVAQEKKEIG